MPATRPSLRVAARAAALAAAVLTAACRRPAADETLRRDLDAAGGGLALAPRGSATQVVSPLELGEGGKAAPTGAPARSTSGTPAPQHLAARAPAAAPRIVRVVRVVERVIVRDAPAKSEAVADAPAPEPARAPEPAPAPASDGPVVAAPSPGSRHLPPDRDVPGRGRGRGMWGVGDVIRNAPFPINPATSF